MPAEVPFEVRIEDTLTLEEIRGKIAQLSTTETGESLASAMDDLKKALRANPSACAAMLPEDIGEMVRHLSRLNNKILEEDFSGAKKGTGKGTKQKKPVIDFNDPAVKKQIEDELLD